MTLPQAFGRRNVDPQGYFKYLSAMKKAKKAATKKVKRQAAHKKSAAKTGINKSGVVPLGDRVMVRALSQEEVGATTSFGLIIPETVDKSKPNQGIVIAVGTGKRNDKGERMGFDVKPGDKIYFSKPWNEPEKINGVEYYFVQESDILAIIK